jgi:hypothetical protein
MKSDDPWAIRAAFVTGFFIGVVAMAILGAV